MTERHRKAVPVLASGLLLFSATPGMPGIALCAWAALVPLLLVSRAANSPANAAWLGLGCGMIFYPLTLAWITIVLGTYGHLDWWLTIPALLLLSLYMSIFLAIFTAGCRFNDDRLPLPILAPTLWVGLDYLRAGLFSGFPWLDLGYTQFRSNPILQTADLFGHHTVTFLIVMVNAMLVVLVTFYNEKSQPDDDRPDRGLRLATTLLPAALLLAAAVGYGSYRQQQVAGLCNGADEITVTVVQGDIPQDEKWSARFQRETVQRYLTLSQKALDGKIRPSLLVWPETALPFYPMESPFFVEVVDTLVNKRQANLLFGAPHRLRPAPNSDPQYFNSAFLMVPADRPLSGMNLPLAASPPYGRISGRYDKQHLVPFGEYIPLRFILPTLAPVVETIGDFTPGRATGPIACENARIGVLICFESIFPELARTHVANGANLLVNITNDAWFGHSNAPWQHLAMATFRAVENRRSLARAANTGVSGCLDPLGHSAKLSTLFTASQITARLPLLSADTIYGRFGHHFGFLCLLISLAGWIRLQSSQKNR
ncbi:MAG: apolipoprotein N-acyltransferase [Desulfobulbaceae bacterium]|nr:apolipoprotein N-acyltransferase [Desulfobulbaceae bacterium]